MRTMHVLATTQLLAPVAAASEAPTPRTVILNNDTYWHAFMRWKTIEIGTPAGEVRVAYDPRTRTPFPMHASPPPPPDWPQPAFDDSAWARAMGPFAAGAWVKRYTKHWRSGSPAGISAICVRGTFTVKDPAAVKDLRLSVRYRGGVVIFINGRELTRAHLPKGLITFDTLAEPYADEAYTRPDGKLLNEGGDRTAFPDRYARRIRSLTDVAVPAEMLRTGVNILAVEVHRAHVNEVRLTAKFAKVSWRGPPSCWATAGLLRVDLTAGAGSPIVPNLTRPRGLQVWNRMAIRRAAVTDYGDPNGPLRPIRLVGARNGVFSGQVVVSSTEAIKGLQAAVSALRLRHGSGVIPADRVAVRFARPDGPRVDDWYKPSPAWFDGLADAPPAVVPVIARQWHRVRLPANYVHGAVQPIWVTVRVPRDAAPGFYEGRLTVRADGLAPTDVPVTLRVHDLTLPDPRRFVTHVDLIQSPESVAMQYNAPMWSDRHWALLEKSFTLMGEVGAKVVYIPLLRRTHFGNRHRMVRWIRGADGTFTHDFSIVERYLDLAIKHLGEVPVVCLYCWERYTGQVYLDGALPSYLKGFKPKGMLYTVLDPATGRLTEAEGPRWGSPAVVAFWRPVMNGMRRILAKRGLESAMMIGIAGDQRPTKAIVEQLKAIVPGAKWVVQAHPRSTSLYGRPVGYATNVWPSGAPPDPSDKRRYGWRRKPYIDATFPREGGGCIGAMRPWSPLPLYRLSSEAIVSAGLNGFGRVGADFWDVVPRRRDTGRSLLGHYPESGWSGLQVQNATAYVLAPGPDGAIPTVRFEMLREGLQATEAKIIIERALLDPSKRARLGDDLPGRCRALLDERIRAILRIARPYRPWDKTDLHWWAFASSGWQKRDSQLYALAGEIAAARDSNHRENAP